MLSSYQIVFIVNIMFYSVIRLLQKFAEQYQRSDIVNILLIL